MDEARQRSHGKTPCETGKLVLPRNMTMREDGYLKLLTEHLKDCYDQCQSVFQQNDGPANTAKVIEDWLKSVGVGYIKDRPLTGSAFPQ